MPEGKSQCQIAKNAALERFTQIISGFKTVVTGAGNNIVKKHRLHIFNISIFIPVMFFIGVPVFSKMGAHGLPFALRVDAFTNKEPFFLLGLETYTPPSMESRLVFGFTLNQYFFPDNLRIASHLNDC